MVHWQVASYPQVMQQLSQGNSEKARYSQVTGTVIHWHSHGHKQERPTARRAPQAARPGRGLGRGAREGTWKPDPAWCVGSLWGARVSGRQPDRPGVQ